MPPKEPHLEGEGPQQAWLKGGLISYSLAPTCFSPARPGWKTQRRHHRRHQGRGAWQVSGLGMKCQSPAKTRVGRWGKDGGGRGLEPGPGIGKMGWVYTRGRQPGSRLAVHMWAVGPWTTHPGRSVCSEVGFTSSWPSPSHRKARLMTAMIMKTPTDFEFLPVLGSCVALSKHSFHKNSQQTLAITDEGNELREGRATGPRSHNCR